MSNQTAKQHVEEMLRSEWASESLRRAVADLFGVKDEPHGDGEGEG